MPLHSVIKGVKFIPRAYIRPTLLYIKIVNTVWLYL